MLKKEYKVLGLKEDASEKQIEEAYKQKTQEILKNEQIKPRMLKKLKKIQNSYLEIKNNQRGETKKSTEEDLTLAELKDTIKNSLNDLYISGTDIFKPKSKSEFKNESEYQDYLKIYYRNSLPSKDKVEALFKSGNCKPRERLEYETAEEYNIYIDEYYNKIMDMKHSNNEVVNQKDIPADNQYIPGTTILKPKDRYDIEQEGIYNSYEEYLAEYYSKVFRDDKDEKIPGRQVNKPRDRYPNETADHYQKFLEEYYKKNVVPIPKMAFNQGKKHKVIATRKNKKHILFVKFLTAVTFIMVSLATLFGLKDSKNKRGTTIGDVNKSIEHVTEDSSITGNDIEQEIEKEVNRIMNGLNKVKTPTIGDIVSLQQGTKYYYDSEKSKPTGTIGNEFSPTSSKYKVDGIALINKKDNTLIKARYEGGLSAKEMMQAYGIEKDDCRVLYHISVNDNSESRLEAQRGWIEFDKNNYQLKKSTDQQTKSNGKQKVKR